MVVCAPVRRGVVSCKSAIGNEALVVMISGELLVR